MTTEEAALRAVLWAFLDAGSWEEKRGVLQREQTLLLSESVSQVLSLMIGRAWRNDEQEDARYLEAHQKLLVRAREVGIEAAWAEFEAARRAHEE
jgi:hypothetical protein